jgi:hypothetical protein
VFIVDDRCWWLSKLRSDAEGLNEEQTATLETALLHAACAVDRAGPDANRSAGLQSDPVVIE